jgi:HEAT repeat protein
MYWPYDPPEQVDFEAPGDRIGKVMSLRQQLASADPPAERRITEELVAMIRTETDPLVREHIVNALAGSSEPMALAVLRAGLNDAATEVRVAACKGLSRHESAESLAALAKTLREDADIDVRQAATRSLASFKGPEAIRALTIALQDRDPALQYLAVESLRKMSAVDYGNDVNAWLEYAQGGHPQPHHPTVAERLRRLSPF